jgi:hypothetical protein
MRGTETSAWLTVLPSTIAGTELSSDELCDSPHIRYVFTPAGLQPTCYGYGASFNTRHAFSCAKDGLAILIHNELHDKLCDMAFGAFQLSVVRDEAKIHKCRPAQAGQPCTQMTENEDRGDILIRGLWERGTNCILGVRDMDTDTPTYQIKDQSKVLQAAEHPEKKKYLQPCLHQHRHFTPFIVSVGGLIGKEAKTVLKVLSARTATKAAKSYSNVMGYTRACLSIATVRATRVCLRGSRIPTSRMSNTHPQWEDTAGMDLLKY